METHVEEFPSIIPRLLMADTLTDISQVKENSVILDCMDKGTNFYKDFDVQLATGFDAIEARIEDSIKQDHNAERTHSGTSTGVELLSNFGESQETKLSDLLSGNHSNPNTGTDTNDGALSASHDSTTPDGLAESTDLTRSDTLSTPT
jgi:hypothetical protein